jgi:hypothetical protein
MQETNNTIKTLAQLQDIFDSHLLLADRHIVKLLTSFILANKNGKDPLWLFIVAASGGGKSEMLNCLEGLAWVHSLDTLTTNTFASGQQRAGQESSLLLKIGSGVLMFKDFTTILSMNKDARAEIMGQLRCVFDGKFDKSTGNGVNIQWRGKMGLIAGVTSIIHQKQQEFASMGERFIQYAMVQPNRKEVQKMKFKNANNIAEIRLKLRDSFTEYITHVLETTEDVDIEFDEKTMDEIIDIADFCTQARTGLSVSDRTGRVDFIPDAEMPTRVTSQLITLAHGLMTVNAAEIPGNKMELNNEDMYIIVKVALDSVPRKRRQAIQSMAKYKLGVTAAALATELGYDTEVMKATLQELTALKMATRVSRMDTYFYVLSDQYRPIVEKFEEIVPLDKELISEDMRDEDTGDRNAEIDEAFALAIDNF